MSSISIERRPLPASNPFNSDYPPALARVLAARGLRSPQELDYSLQRLLPPGGLTNIDAAADLLAEAVMAQGSVVVVGDFDADGATSCALAVSCLRAMGMAEVSYLVPNRFEYGYGLTPEIVGVAAARQPDIIVTVDNGISSHDGVDVAHQLGITVLVTDHHLPGDAIPTADVIVNPNLPGDAFASKNLAGVGVIFYVLSKVRARLRAEGWFVNSGLSEPNMADYLDLVALGTVADVVPLDRNNRVLVHNGLQRIRAQRARPGINALLQVAGRSPKSIVASDLGFAVGPRLNAAGRLDDMAVGIECLLAEDEAHALALAGQLDQLNRERRDVEQGMQTQAQAIVAQISLDQAQPPAIYVLHDEGWHQGVVGLVASRIKEATNRPTLALAPGDQEGEWKGSARSIPGIHIRDMLARLDAVHPGLMSKFGGHAMAAGLSVSDAKLGKLVSALQSVAQEMTAEHDWQQVCWSDGELQADEYSLAMAEQLEQITPWGQAFPAPAFDAELEVLEARIVGDTHAKMTVRPVGSELAIDAICFRYLERHAELPEGQVRAVFRLDINEWQARQNLQLLVEHIEAV